MDPRVVDMIASLSLRDVPRTSPRDASAWLDAQPDLTTRDAQLLRAAVAMRSGDPGQVPALLAGDDSPLAGALRVGAALAGRNCFPGGHGAVMEEGDLEAFVDPPAPDPADAAEAMLTLVVGHVEGMVSNWRSISSGPAFGFAPALARVQQLSEVARSIDAGWLASYLRLVAADLHRLAGDRETADREARSAIDDFAGSRDALGVAASQVMLAGWFAAPHSAPELLDLTIDSTPSTDGTVELATARELYAEARATYEQSSELGHAATLLREGHVARAAGDLDDWARAADEAEQLATRADDQWLATLAAFHGAFAAFEMGRRIDPTALAERAVNLLERGSRAWVRGLVRLSVAHSTQQRDRGAFVVARRSLEVAQIVAGATQAPLEVVDVTDRLLELYGRYSFPVSRAVLELATVNATLESDAATDDPLMFGALANRAMSAVNLGTRAIDGEVLTAAAETIERLLDVPTSPDAEAFVTPLREFLAPTASMCRVTGPLYSGRAATRDGRVEEGDKLAGQALAALDDPANDDPLLRAVVLGTLRRRDEALAIVDGLDPQAVDRDILARLYLRIGAADKSMALLDDDPDGQHLASVTGQGWDRHALRAEALAATGRLAEVPAIADAGIEAFESALAQHSRDVLKTSATEDLDAADLYLARILADVPMAIAGDLDACTRSFATSDRARSISNSERVTGTRSEPALRRWLALGSRWATTFEDLGALVGSLDDVSIDATRRRIGEAEAELDDAEDDLLASDPAAFTALQARRPPLDVDAIASALPDDAVLLQFHCWNDELISWALTSTDLRIQRISIDGRRFAGDVASFRTMCAGRLPRDPVLGAALTDVLVEPWRELLDDHERIVVVPHSVLAGLPFHLLGRANAALAMTHVVSYSPSAAHVPHLSAGLAAGRALVVGDPAYDASEPFQRLPGSGVEARAVGATLGTDLVLVGDAATRSAVFDAAPGAALLHFGTHGLLDDRWPNRTTLALAGSDRLTIADLLELDIDGAMVVLSACNTGRGRATASGDVVGLVRAVLASGASSLVASLWPVHDMAGCLVMNRFYTRLSESPGDAASALTFAARDVAALHPAEREAEYVALAARFDMTNHSAGTREVAPDAAPPADDIALWAPFVYVGR